MEKGWREQILKQESLVGDQAVCSTFAVEELEDLTMFHQLCTEEFASCVVQLRFLPNIGENQLFLVFIGPSYMRMTWMQRESQMPSSSTWKWEA